MERKNDGFRKPSFSSDAGFQKQLLKLRSVLPSKALRCFGDWHPRMLLSPPKPKFRCERLPFSGVGNPCSSLKGTLEPGFCFPCILGNWKRCFAGCSPFGLHSAEGRLAASGFHRCVSAPVFPLKMKRFFIFDAHPAWRWLLCQTYSSEKKLA